MQKTYDIKPNLMIHAMGPGEMDGIKGVHIGTVDHLDGEYIKMKKTDTPDGKHHWIPLNCVESVDRHAVYLNMSATEARGAIIDKNPLSVQ